MILLIWLESDAASVLSSGLGKFWEDWQLDCLQQHASRTRIASQSKAVHFPGEYAA
jgi:hypothetical protein